MILMNQDPSLTTLIALSGAIGAVVGGLIAAIGGILVRYLESRALERRQFRELVVTAAIANYQGDRDFSKAVLEHRPGLAHELFPFDDYLIHMSQLAEMVMKEDLSREEMLNKMRELTKTTHALRDLHRELKPPPPG